MMIKRLYCFCSDQIRVSRRTNSNNGIVSHSGPVLAPLEPGCIIQQTKPKDVPWKEIYSPNGHKAIHPSDRAQAMSHKLPQFDSDYVAAQVGADDDDDEEKSPDKEAKIVDEMLPTETLGRGRPKALCYEDNLLMVVRHPVTGDNVHVMAVKFIHHKGADNKPKSYVFVPIYVADPLSNVCRTIFLFTPTRRLMFCLITIIISIAVHDNAFDAQNLTIVRSVWGVKNSGLVQCTQLRWKKEWLKRPVFRRFDGPEISQEKALQYSKLRDDMVRQSLDAGQEKPMQPKDFRRGAAIEANGMSFSCSGKQFR